MAQYEIKSCKAIEKFGSKLGINDVKGYQFKLLIDFEDCWITIGAPEGFLPSVKVTNVPQYREFREKVVPKTMDDSVYNKIKDPWKENNKECFALVHSGRITYKASWEGQVWFEALLNTQKAEDTFYP